MKDAAELKSHVYDIVGALHSVHDPFQSRQMGTGELARAPKASCFKKLFPIIRRLGGELRRCARPASS